MNKHLEAKMNEFAKHHNEALRYFENASFDSVYKNGFEAGAAEVMKQAQKLVEALETYAALSPRTLAGDDTSWRAKQALAEWKEFQSE